MRYNDSEKPLCYGRIRCFVRKKGYGFIRLREGEDIFFSSFDFHDKEHGRYGACIGSLVSFAIKEKNGTYYADDIAVVNKFPSGRTINFPSGRQFILYDIDKYGLAKDEKGKSFLYLKFLSGNEFCAYGSTIGAVPEQFFAEMNKKYLTVPEI